MYNARTVCGGYIIIGNNNMRFLPVQRVDGTIKQRLIGTADQSAAGEFVYDLNIFLTQHGSYQILGQNVDDALLFGTAVGNVAVDAKADVAGQRPGRGRPGQIIGILITALKFGRSGRSFTSL